MNTSRSTVSIGFELRKLAQRITSARTRRVAYSADWLSGVRDAVDTVHADGLRHRATALMHEVADAIDGSRFADAAAAQLRDAARELSRLGSDQAAGTSGDVLDLIGRSLLPGTDKPGWGIHERTLSAITTGIYALAMCSSLDVGEPQYAQAPSSARLALRDAPPWDRC